MRSNAVRVFVTQVPQIEFYWIQLVTIEDYILVVKLNYKLPDLIQLVLEGKEFILPFYKRTKRTDTKSFKKSFTIRRASPTFVWWKGGV